MKKLKAPEELISNEDLHTGKDAFKVWTRKGWGRGNWFVIRKTDRKVMTSGDVKKCAHWVCNFGNKHLA